MDIKCERCGSEYEFDDSRVTEEGITVKCSTCGHLFKIRKKSFLLTEPVTLEKSEKGLDDSKGKAWMVRKPDGTILSFKELTTLQKWIVERRVSREDEISKSGDNWKRLGSIAELASFFRVVDQAAVPTANAMPAVTPPMGSVSAAPAYPIAPTFPTAPSYPAPTTAPTMPAASYPSMPAAQPAPQSYPSMPAASAPAAPPSYPSMPAAPATGPYPSQPSFPSVPPPSGRPEPDSWGESGEASEDDVVEKWKRRGRRKWFVIVPILAILVGVGVFYLVDRVTFMKLVHKVIGGGEAELSPLAAAQFKSGYESFLKDSPAKLEEAIKNLDGAILETKGKFPAAMAMLGQVYVTRADRAAEKIKLLDAGIAALEGKIKPLMPPDGKEPQGEARDKIAPLHNEKVKLQEERLKVVSDARKDLDEAEREITGAREQDPNGFEPKVALVDLMRVKAADRAQIEVPLREAQVLHKDDPELLYVEGAVSADDPAALDSAVEKLSQAIDRQQSIAKPDLLRARYKLAQVRIAQKRPDEAKVQLERILQQSPDHEAAKALLASLAPPPPPPPEEKKPEEKPKEPGAPTTYEGWVELGNSLQGRGRSKQALDAFDSALALKPDDFEALTGKGLCFLDLGSYGSAVQAFRAALQHNRNYADAIMGLAEAYKYQGNKTEAVKYYQRYLDVLPNGPESSVAKHNLDELK